MPFHGPPSNSPPYQSTPTFQPPQQQQMPQQPHWMQQQFVTPRAIPQDYYTADYSGYNGGYPPYQPPYSQAPAYNYYQTGPPVMYPFMGSPYVASASGSNGAGATSPHLSPSNPFSPNFNNFSPFSPLGSPSGGLYMNPTASFSVSSDGGLQADRKSSCLIRSRLADSCAVLHAASQQSSRSQ